MLSNSLLVTGMANALEIHCETVQLEEKWIHNDVMF